MTTSVLSAVDWWAQTKGDRVALVFSGDDLTYRSLRNWSSRVAERLVGGGVRPGDRIGLLGSNSLAWAAAAQGVLRAGAVLVPINPRLVGPELHKILRDSGTTAVIADPAFDPALAAARALGSEVTVVGLDSLAGLRDGPDATLRIEREPDEPVAILFTSGSTGLSKGVVCTNRTLLDIVFEASLREEGMRPGCTSLLVLPLAFTPGLVWGLTMSTVLGGTLIVEPELDPSRAVELLERHRVQVLFGVPLIYRTIADAPEFADADLSSLSSAFVGGAAVPVALLRDWGAKGVRLRQIYGMTEAGGIATATLPEESDDQAESCGVGSVFTEFKVLRPDGTEAGPEEPGEIVLRGPGVTPGYWNDPATTAVAFRDGWLYSGDLGVRDDAGRLRFLDRMKDLIISGGINISPVEIEEVIGRIPGVREVAVIAVRDEKFGETPAAIITISEEIDERTVVDYCQREMANYKVPRYVVLRRQPLPRLPSGKLSKREIRVEYAHIAEDLVKVR